MSRDRVLVFGGSGFIGCNLVRLLVQEGAEVTVAVREDSRRDVFDGLDINYVVGDLLDENADSFVNEAIRDHTQVYNLAVSLSHHPANTGNRERINVEAVGLIADAVMAAGAKLVHVSSTSAIGYPENGQIADETTPFNGDYCHYSSSKHRGDLEILKRCEQGLNAVICSPGSTMGAHGIHPHQRSTIEAISKGRMVVYPPGGVCLVHVSDIAKGLMLAMKKGRSGERYIIGGDNVSYKDYFGSIAAATGGRTPFIRVPRAAMTMLGYSYEFLAKLLGRKGYLTRENFEIVSQNIFYSSEKAKRELGYSFMPMEETTRLTAEELGLARPRRGSYGV